jgi:hypothetical protein
VPNIVYLASTYWRVCRICVCPLLTLRLVKDGPQSALFLSYVCPCLLTLSVKPQPLWCHTHAESLLVCLLTCLDARWKGYNLLSYPGCFGCPPYTTADLREARVYLFLAFSTL